MATFPPDEVARRLRNLPGWTFHDNAISRKFTFPGFPDAIAFIVRLGFAAEAADHHPDLLLNFKRVTVTYSTHSEGGVTTKDFDGATKAAEIAGIFGGA